MITLPTKLLIASSINKENWQEKKNRLKEKFPHLTESDLDFDDGSMYEIIDRLHIKIGMAQGNTIEGLLKYIERL
jgi:hypothetical protein